MPFKHQAGVDRAAYLREYRRQHPEKWSETPTHRTWRAMRARCNNPNNQDYALYGGRGIKVCQRWDSYAAFLEDMGERPEGMTLDRIDPNGDYTRDNCRWATALDQRHNRRVN